MLRETDFISSVPTHQRQASKSSVELRLQCDEGDNLEAVLQARFKLALSPGAPPGFKRGNAGTFSSFINHRSDERPEMFPLLMAASTKYLKSPVL